jgi:hypothetical protein
MDDDAEGDEEDEGIESLMEEDDDDDDDEDDDDELLLFVWFMDGLNRPDINFTSLSCEEEEDDGDNDADDDTEVEEALLEIVTLRAKYLLFPPFCLPEAETARLNIFCKNSRLYL